MKREHQRELILHITVYTVIVLIAISVAIMTTACTCKAQGGQWDTIVRYSMNYNDIDSMQNDNGKEFAIRGVDSTYLNYNSYSKLWQVVNNETGDTGVSAYHPTIGSVLVASFSDNDDTVNYNGFSPYKNYTSRKISFWFSGLPCAGSDILNSNPPNIDFQYFDMIGFTLSYDANSNIKFKHNIPTSSSIFIECTQTGWKKISIEHLNNTLILRINEDSACMQNCTYHMLKCKNGTNKPQQILFKHWPQEQYGNCWKYSDLIVQDFIPDSIVTYNLPELTRFQMYPNPVTDKITLKFDEYFKGTVSVYDNLGRKVLSKTTEPRYTNLDATTLLPGIYLLVVESGSSRTSKQFVKIENDQ